jgi:hypothetical protein
MPNPYKIAPLVLIAAFSLGAASLMPPRVAGSPIRDAPTLACCTPRRWSGSRRTCSATGQTLTGVLAQARITGQEMADLLLGLRQHLNPRRLAGSEVTVRRWSRTTSPVPWKSGVNRTARSAWSRRTCGWDGTSSSRRRASTRSTRAA